MINIDTSDYKYYKGHEPNGVDLYYIEVHFNERQPIEFCENGNINECLAKIFEEFKGYTITKIYIGAY